jgi:hypothetical protein
LNYKSDTTYEILKNQLAILGKIHGRFYGSSEPALQKLNHFTEGWRTYVEMCDVKTACNNGWRAAKSVIPPAVYKRANDDTWEGIQLVTERNYKLPATLVHCDVHGGASYVALLRPFFSAL